MKVFGLGLVAALVGVIVSLPLAVRPLAALIAAPLRWRGLPGELAKQNAMRNPRRTSSTAAALMIGLTLVVSMGVFASSLKDSFGDVICDKTECRPVRHDLQQLRARASARRSSRRSQGVSAASSRCRPAAGARRASSGWTPRYSAVDPATAGEVMNLDVSEGSLADLGKDGVVVSRSPRPRTTGRSGAR